MTDLHPPLEAPHAALLVMDYQAGIVDRVPEADQLLERARGAIDLVRDWGGQIGYVRVAFEDEDYDFPASSRMGASGALVSSRSLRNSLSPAAFRTETR